jgi:hypothetical protein
MERERPAEWRLHHHREFIPVGEMRRYRISTSLCGLVIENQFSTFKHGNMVAQKVEGSNWVVALCFALLLGHSRDRRAEKLTSKG